MYTYVYIHTYIYICVCVCVCVDQMLHYVISGSEQDLLEQKARAFVPGKNIYPVVNLIKHFWHEFTYSFCMLDHFIKICNICCTAMKRSSLQKRVSKFTLKSFMRSTPGPTF